MAKDWFHKDFTDQEVRELKERQDKTAKKLNYNNYINQAPRWIGTAVELAFKDWLDHYGFEYKYWQKDGEFDDRDFTFGRLEIDVKSRSQTVEAKDYYYLSVVGKQWDKIKKQGLINCLVFGAFLLPENRAYVYGWLPVSEFEREAKFMPKGTLSGKIILQNDGYNIMIKQLKELIDIDRFR